MCSREEVQEVIAISESKMMKAIRDMEERIEADILRKYNDAIARVHRPAPETNERLCRVESWQTEHQKATEIINQALFGNEALGQKGIVAQNNEMYQFIIQAGGFKKWLNIFLLIGGASAMLYTFFKKF